MKNNRKRVSLFVSQGTLILAITIILPLQYLFCTDAITLQFGYKPGDKFKITEISDLRKRENDKYIGFVYKQTRGILDVTATDNGSRQIKGDFYIFQESRRDTRLIANQVDRIVPVTFSLAPDGSYQATGNFKYPVSRDFPVFPARGLKPGDSWTAHGIRYVEPFNDGVFTKVKFFCEYKYQGISKYKEVPSHLITAQYAIRYKAGDDPAGDPRIKEIKNGGHEVTIYFDAASQKPLFIKDNIIENLGGEVYVLFDKSTITLKGFTQTWFDFIPTMDKEQIITEIKEDVEKENKEKIPEDKEKITEDKEKIIIEEKDKEKIVIEEKDNGIRLSLPNIRFYPDSAQILPGENPRLDTIYNILSKVADRTLLITGHTASIGNPQGEYQLSIQRAKAIADYLINKGIPAKRFLYEGKGANEPVAPNDTEENKAQNRRVEIMILED